MKKRIYRTSFRDLISVVWPGKNRVVSHRGFGVSVDAVDQRTNNSSKHEKTGAARAQGRVVAVLNVVP